MAIRDISPRAPAETGGSAPRTTGAPAMASVFAVLALLTTGFALRSEALAAVAMASGWLLAATHARSLAQTVAGERRAAWAIAAVLAVSLPFAAARSATAVAHHVVEMTALVVALVAVRDLDAYARAVRGVLVASQAGVIAFLATTGLQDAPLDRLLPDSSSNGVTSYLIVLQASHCIAWHATRRRAPLVTPLVTLAICIVGYGRGSILAALALVSVNALAVIAAAPPKKALVLACAATIASALLWQQHGPAVMAFAEAETKLGAGFQDQHRERQINEYLGRIDAVSLLVGADYRGTSIESDYNGNPHNSYIRAHHIFGLPYLAVILLLPFLTITWRHRLTALTYSGAVLVILLGRAFTEPILFPTLLDVFYFGSCFAVARCMQPREPGNPAP